jgi:hypothetical protein
MDYKYTEKIADMLDHCEDVKDLQEILSNLAEQKTRWKKKSSEIFDVLLKRQGLTKAKYSKSALASIIECSRPTLDSWLKGVVPSREYMIRIGLVAGYDEAGINELLTKFGYYQELYPKILSDCVCLFVLNTYDENRCEKYLEIMKTIEKDLIADSEEEEVAIDTKHFGEQVVNLASEAELANFISSNIGAFKSIYHRFYAKIDAIFYGAGEDQGMFEKGGLSHDYVDEDDFYFNAHSKFGTNVFTIAEEQQWSASLRRAVSEMRMRKWIPTREKIISLGIHLNLDRDEIDELLCLAHMRKLYPKNLFEALIIYITVNAGLIGIYDTGEYNPKAPTNGKYDDDDYALLNYTYDVLKDYRKYPEIDEFFGEITRVE